MQDEIIISIDRKGTITAIYDDRLSELFKQGQLTIKRASHVEPTENGQWAADMSPVGGPTLGPFRFRETALNAEVEYLKENYFNAG